MNEFQPVRFYVILVVFFIAALVFGGSYFVTGMNGASYLLSDGMSYELRYLDKPRYEMNMQGFIYAASFLVAGSLMVMMIILPDKRAPQAMPGMPQPVGEGDEAAPAPEEPGEGQTDASRRVNAGGTIEWEDTEPVETEEDIAAKKAAKTVKEAKARMKSGKTSAFELSREDGTEDDEADVLYGNGRISDIAAWEFLQAYPDSAVKFLYRKGLDNKGISKDDEGIYQRWEMRGMSRAKMREMVLELMEWDSLPDELPHNIWRHLRDQLYEIQGQRH